MKKSWLPCIEHDSNAFVVDLATLEFVETGRIDRVFTDSSPFHAWKMNKAAATTIDSGASELFWEPVSHARWGQYLSEVEERHIRFAHQLFDHPARALEIGAEGGRWSKLLADLNWKMTCTDIHAEGLEVCQSRIPEAKCIHVDANSEEIPCVSGSQRLLLCIEVSEVMETDWFVKEVDRVLESGGAFVGVFQNVRSIRGIFKTLYPDPDDPSRQYKNAYGPWKQKVESKGFTFIREEGICWMPFGRRSNSPLIPLATKAESLLGLRKLVSFSPWIVCVVRKS